MKNYKCSCGLLTKECAICAPRATSQCSFGICRSKADLTIEIHSAKGKVLERRSCCRRHRTLMRQTAGVQNGETLHELALASRSTERNETMNTTTTIQAHREKLTKLHQAKERLTSVRFRGKHHSSTDTEESCLAEIRQLERDITRERTQNLRRWTVIERADFGDHVELLAWEPSSLFQHSTFRRFTVDEGGYCGQIGSRPLPQDIEDMRGGSPERLAAVEAWNEAENREAWLAIVARYPEAATGEMRSGRITVKKHA